MSKHTISILVHNHSGVLSRVSGLFARRGFNIDSLAVGITDNAEISRITIVVDGDEHTVEQVEKQLNKLIDVIKLRRIASDDLISRELILIKVESTENTSKAILEIATEIQAKICDNSGETITIEISDTSEHIELATAKLSPYNILEVVRTGTIALDKKQLLLVN